jgi:glycosyltransferase involved in cell wall biosynthesis
LPHGLQLAAYRPATAEDEAWVGIQLGPYVRRNDFVVGCVATNQPRKDLGLYFQTLRVLIDRGYPVYGWLHTDVLTKAWSIVQLVEDCGLQKRVTVSTTSYTDRQLALLYQRCSVTIAPGLGEGFGYPIVESLASGVPVVHGDFGGGRELVPKREWRFPVREIRLDGIYAQCRPVFRADDVANAIVRAWQWREAVGAETAAAYCRGSVAHLGWEALWPRWRSWIKGGL